MEYDVVWLTEYRRFGFIKIRHLTHSLVYFQTEDGWVNEWVENDDYELWEERAIDYDESD